MEEEVQKNDIKKNKYILLKILIMGFKIANPKRYGLSRNSKNRWHLWRT